jgi:hypothetical protein
MCQVCTLALRHQSLNKTKSQHLNRSQVFSLTDLQNLSSQIGKLSQSETKMNP